MRIPRHTPENPNFRHNKSGMNLKLFVDIDNRKLVRSKTSDFPVNLATLFREDWIDLEIMLLEPTGTLNINTTEMGRLFLVSTDLEGVFVG